MLDKNIEKTFDKMLDILNSQAVEELESHLTNLYRKMEDLTLSRNKWKRRYEELKEKNKK